MALLSKKPYLSIVIPLYNEEENILPLYEEISHVLKNLRREGEIIFIDDGSTDKSFQILKNLVAKDKRIKVIQFKRNFGQTAALSAGIEFSKGEVVIPMDGDLQNDPNDIPKLLAKLEEGYDVVSGWRKNRKDPYLTRKIPSSIANWLISVITKVKLHDYGCTLKAYRREAIERIRLYGEMHRFIPAYAAWEGARITELTVNHRPRIRGKSKYGITRTFKVLLDLITVKFLGSFSTKPLYIFGGGGAIFLLGGFVSGSVLIYLKLFKGVYMIQSPLLHLTALLITLGFQMLLMGLLAELLVRVYYESLDKKPFVIKEKINI